MPEEKRMIECDNLRSYVCSGTIEDWIREYTTGTGINFSKYHDPDSDCQSFYEDLVLFLNIQEKNNYIYWFNNTGPFGIEVRENIDGKPSEPLFYLKSDQFGFSAPSNPKKLDHPYDIYIKRMKNKKDACEKVARWIYGTRRLGGSFLWPMECDGSGGWIENPKINKARGGANPFDEKGNYRSNRYNRYYMEDRVDLMLLEIKQVLDHISESKSKEGLLWQNCLPETNLMKWLRHFGTFDNYVTFFCFNDFVDKNHMPLDIVNSKLDESNCIASPLSDKNGYKDHREENSIFKLSTKDMERMFNNVDSVIKKRTKMMKDIIGIKHVIRAE